MICKACGAEKPPHEFYTTTQPGAARRYPYCTDCWSLDMRRRYLTRKRDKHNKPLSPEEECELQSILALYQRRRDAGLQQPGDKATSRPTAQDILREQLEKFQ